MANTDFKELRVKVPSFDVVVNDPFTISLDEVLTKLPASIDVKVDLPPLINVEIPVIDMDVEELAHIVSRDFYDLWSSGFEDVVTSVPMITEEVVKYTEREREELSKSIKSKKLLRINIRPGKIIIEPITPMAEKVPDEIRDRYTIKIRIKREVTPEIREVIESRLTKEFKITRMIKKMEVIRDEKILSELERLLRFFSKKIKRR